MEVSKELKVCDDQGMPNHSSLEVGWMKNEDEEEDEVISAELVEVELESVEDSLSPPVNYFDDGLGRDLREGEKWVCGLCGLVTVFELLVDHMQSHNGFPCSDCVYQAPDGDSLMSHFEVAHPGTMRNNCTQFFYCSFCDYKTPRAKDLRVHERRHTGEKPFSCSQCSYATSYRRSLKEHERIHTGEKPFSCSYCRYSTSRKRDLRVHERIHLKKKKVDNSPPRKALEKISNKMLKKPPKKMSPDIIIDSNSLNKVCGICGVSVSFELLIEHMREHNNGKFPNMNTISLNQNGKPKMVNHCNSCSECGYVASSSSKLKLHMRKHTGEKPYKCSECDFTTSWKRNLKIHQRKHTGERPYACVHCQYMTSDKSTLRKHIKLHLKNSYSFRYGYRMSNAVSEKNCKRNNFQEKVFKCPHCSFCTLSKSDLKEHDIIHKQLPEERLNNLEDNKDNIQNDTTSEKEVKIGEPWVCGICGHLSSSLDQLVAHMTVHREKGQVKDEKNHTPILNKPNICCYCGYIATTKSRLAVHVRRHIGKQPYSCSQCEFTTSWKRTLKIHQREHTGQKPYSCTVCSYTTLYAGTLKKHMRNHFEEKMLKCLECNYSTFYQREMKLHVMVHRKHIKDEKVDTEKMKQDIHLEEQNFKQNALTNDGEPWTCGICRKSFPFEQLLEHIKEHKDQKEVEQVKESTEENINFVNIKKTRKPAICQQCGYAAASKSKLKLHMRKHTGEKPFSCSQCSFSTSWKRNLKIHQRIHSGEKPYSCSLCAYSTLDKSSLRKHKKVHEEGGAYSCAQCDFTTSYKRSLKLHEKNHQKQSNQTQTIQILKEEPPDEVLTKGKEPWTCGICGHSTVLELLVLHMKEHNSLTKCADEKTDIVSGKVAHSKAKVTNVKLMMSNLHRQKYSKEYYLCFYCDFKTRNKKYLRTHVGAHNFRKELTCSLCAYSAKNKYDLKSHERNHIYKKLVLYPPSDSFTTKEKKDDNEVIKDTFPNPKNHIKISKTSSQITSRQKKLSKQEDPVSSRMRLRSFGRKVEDEVYRFCCSLCPFSTATKASFKNHQSYHLKETLFCFFCDYKARKRSRLKQHLVKHKSKLPRSSPPG